MIMLRPYFKKADLCDFLMPAEKWLLPDGTHNLTLFSKDKLHLSEDGYRKLAMCIKNKVFISAFTTPPIKPFHTPLLTYEYAIGEFELVSSHDTVSSTPQSFVIPSSVTTFNQSYREASLKSFSLSLCYYHFSTTI